MLTAALRKPTMLAAMTGLLAIMPPSDQCGAYAVVDRVVLTPNATNPTSVQIWGKFSISDQKGGDHYSRPVSGYLYYAVSPRAEQASRNEWADLQSVAGKNALVGFGAKYNTGGLGRVRCASEAPAKPDVYPIGTGVVKVPASYNTGWELAAEMLKAKAPDAPCT